VERLKRLGEQEFRIFDTGAPQLDDMVGRSFKQDQITLDGKDFDLTEPYVVLIQHPVMHQHDQIVAQIEATLHACFATGLGIVWIYPNSDFGFRDILAIIERQRSHDRIVAVPNLDREDYLTVLANASCLVGNSSSGLLEAPTFRIPVVNIGNRQRGRPQALNIVNASYEPADIERAIRFVLTDAKFREACSRAVNPFGDGKSAERIVGILRDIRIDQALLDKQTTY
jgi:GDP/UDP-N,N'-diacetylbacillosamine 2-epimerase (hydrolysing)